MSPYSMSGRDKTLTGCGRKHLIAVSALVLLISLVVPEVVLPQAPRGLPRPLDRRLETVPSSGYGTAPTPPELVEQAKQELRREFRQQPPVVVEPSLDITSLRQDHQNILGAVDALRQRLEGHDSSVTDRLDTVKEELEKLRKEIPRTIVEQHKKTRTDVAKRVEDAETRIVKRIAAAEKNIIKRMTVAEGNILKKIEKGHERTKDYVKKVVEGAETSINDNINGWGKKIVERLKRIEKKIDRPKPLPVHRNWLTAYLEWLRTWKHKLKEVPPPPELPTDVQQKLKSTSGK